MRTFLLSAILLVAMPLMANPIVIDDSRETQAPSPATNDEVAVAMASEDVRLTLTPERGLVRREGFRRDPSAARLHVKGTYKFTNPGEQVELLIGFPCRGKVEAASVVVTMNGARLATEPYEPEKNEDDYWFGDWVKWKATFAGNGESEMIVEYSLVLYDKRKIGYILHTGSSWKDAIRDISVSLTLAKGFTIGHLREVEPTEGMTRSEDGVLTWRYEDMEPSRADDILVEFSTESWDEKIQRMEEDARKSWRARLEVAKALTEPPLEEIKDLGELTRAQQDRFLSALERLVPRFEEKDGQLTLHDDTPPREPLPDGGSPLEWDDRLDGVFEEIVRLAVQAIDEIGPEPRVRAVLEKLVKILRASEADTLHFECDGVTTQATLPTPSYLLGNAEDRLTESD